jgi:formate dehydrogenase subunit delta
MQNKTLIKMANQIGEFFEPEPDKSQAEKDIAHHLNRFWTLDMRQQISRYASEKNTDGLHDIVVRAIKQHLKI